MPLRTSLAIVISITLLALASPALAWVEAFTSQSFDFVSQKVKPEGRGFEAIYSALNDPAEEVDLTDEGLLLEPGALMELPPLSIYTGDRIMNGCTVKTKLHIVDGDAPSTAGLSIRYSANGKLWSDWIEIRQKKYDDAGPQESRFVLRVEPSDATNFRKYWNQWGKWTGANVSEYVAWLDREHPDVMQSVAPFITVAQLRLENTSQTGATVSSISWSYGATLSGLRQ